MLKPILIILFFTAQLCFQKSYAQDFLKHDSVSIQAEKYVIDYFNKAMGQQLPLYNGKEYDSYLLNQKTNPNYNNYNSWKQGVVNFDGYTYTNVPLKYDLFKDILVALLYNNVSEYVFASERVAGFEIEGHSFKYIAADTTINCPASGFYEVLNAGRVSALARFAKTMQNSYDNNTIEPYFTNATVSYYIKRDRDFIAAGSQNSLLNALKDHKKELQQYIKKNNIKYRKQPAAAMALITAYYNQISL